MGFLIGLIVTGIVVVIAYFVIGPALVAAFVGWSLLNPFVYAVALSILVAFSGGALLRRILGLPRMDPKYETSSIGNDIVDSLYGDNPRYLFAYVGQALIVGLFVGWLVRIWFNFAPTASIFFLVLLALVPTLIGLIRGVVGRARA